MLRVVLSDVTSPFQMPAEAAHLFAGISGPSTRPSDCPGPRGLQIALGSRDLPIAPGFKLHIF